MIVLMQKVRGAVIFALFQRHGEQPPCVLLFCFSNALFFLYSLWWTTDGWQGDILAPSYGHQEIWNARPPPRFSFHACVTTLNNGFCICMQDSFVKIYNLDILISTPECLTLSPRVPPPNTVNFSLFAVCVFAEWAPAGPTICTGRSSKKFKNISEPANKSPAKGWKDRRADVMHAMAKQKAYSFFLVCPLIFFGSLLRSTRNLKRMDLFCCVSWGRVSTCAPLVRVFLLLLLIFCFVLRSALIAEFLAIFRLYVHQTGRIHLHLLSFCCYLHLSHVLSF